MTVRDCPRHRHCAYTGTEPGLCPTCHASTGKCASRHGRAPYSGWDTGAAGATHPALIVGQHNDPRKASGSKLPRSTPQQSTTEQDYAA